MIQPKYKIKIINLPAVLIDDYHTVLYDNGQTINRIIDPKIKGMLGKLITGYGKLTLSKLVRNYGQR